MILYLHGFRSAPASHKAQALAARMQQLGLSDQFWCEQLPPDPDAAIQLVDAQIRACLAAHPDRPPTLVGSSLGGYYATWLAERHDLNAVLVNPSVVAALSLHPWLGPQTNLYTGETFVLTESHLDALRALEVPHLGRPERYWLLVETGDEVLDYRDAVERYAGARQTVLPDGDHGFSRWHDYLDAVLAFAGLLHATDASAARTPR